MLILNRRACMIDVGRCPSVGLAGLNLLFTPSGALRAYPAAFDAWTPDESWSLPAAARLWASAVTFLSVAPSRVDITFPSPYVEIDAACFVLRSSPLQQPIEVDRPGIRIAVSDKSAY